jgi:hypothetical protein
MIPATAIQVRPLMPLQAVMWRLDLDEPEVITLIDSGELLWAFDVRTPRAERPSVRVLTQSVEKYLAGFGGGKLPVSGNLNLLGENFAAGDEEAEWLEVAAQILPDKQAIVTCEIARALNCGRQMAHDLVNANQFRLMPGSVIRRGPGGSPKIETASVAEWLRKRRML